MFASNVNSCVTQSFTHLGSIVHPSKLVRQSSRDGGFTIPNSTPLITQHDDHNYLTQKANF